MEKVAEHINEMQRIHEEYGAIFDHLFRQHQKSCKQPIDLSPGSMDTNRPLRLLTIPRSYFPVVLFWFPLSFYSTTTIFPLVFPL